MAKRLTKQDRWDRCMQAAIRIRACVNGLKAENLENDPETAVFFSGIIGEWIYRLPFDQSGLISKKAANSKRAPTSDHFYGRTASGQLVYQQVVNGASAERIAYILRSRCRVHLVTSAENTKLKYVDCKKRLKSKTQIQQEYKAAGITLIPRVRKQKYVYLIDGVKYSKDEAMDKLNVSLNQLTYRVNHPGKKWGTWQKKENQ
jgi:hypothetical protein